MPKGHLVFALILLTTLVAACGDDTVIAPENTSAVRPPTVAARTPAAHPDPPSDGPLPRLRLVLAFPSVSAQRMTGAYQAPDGRWFVLEQSGRILVFEGQDAQAGLFLDLRDRVSAPGGEEGLLGLALSPDFASSGIFFLNYTAANPRRTVISSFTSSGATGNPASEAVVLEVAQPFANHNGGQIAFGPDGYLYIGMGDGGSAGDPRRHGQDRTTLLGALLRVDVADRSAYRTPPDNPFVGRDGRDEIWAYGLRNPWRFSFDSGTGALWLADVGQNDLEEINIVEKGGNYGWNTMEGTRCFRAATCDGTGLTPPIFEYRTAGAAECAITGGFVYRGSSLPDLRGAYIYGDYCAGTIWSVRYRDGTLRDQAQIASADFPISSFAQDSAGEVYVLEYAARGAIYRIAQ